MKPINKYRSTKTFCITGAEMIATLVSHYGKDLVAIGHDPREHEHGEFTVRLSRTGYGIADVRCSALLGYVEEFERKMIVDWRRDSETDRQLLEESRDGRAGAYR